MFQNTQFRLNSAHAEQLNNDQLRQTAPSIFLDEVSEDRSMRYRMVKTITVVEAMRDVGFYPVAVQQSGARSQQGHEVGLHSVRFRHRSAMDMVTNKYGSSGEEFEEIMLLNSHNTMSSFQLYLSVFRKVCMNGLVMSSDQGHISIPHVGNVVERVVAGAAAMVEHVTELAEARHEMSKIELDDAERFMFANAALQLRYSGRTSPIEAHDVLTRRRIADSAPTLWNTLNVVQENMIRGGLRGHTTTGRRTSTREITSISSDLAINRMLWSLAEAARNMKETLGTSIDMPAVDIIEA